MFKNFAKKKFDPLGAVKNGPASKNAQIYGWIIGRRLTFTAIDWIGMVDGTFYCENMKKNLSALAYFPGKWKFFDSYFHQI